jgi:hypothetical protein
LRRIAHSRGRVFHVIALHEPDDSCCEIEPWLETLSRIRQALADDGEKARAWA